MKNRMIATVLIATLASFMLADAASAYYSPRLGRFLSRDPIAEPGAILARTRLQPTSFLPRDPIAPEFHTHAYRFVKNSPVGLVDPLGLQAQKPATQCMLNSQPLTMKFDGRTFSGGTFSTDAASGVPTRTYDTTTDIPNSGIFGPLTDDKWIVTHYVFDYSKARQKMNSVGPTKEGKYWIDTCGTNSCANAWRHKVPFIYKPPATFLPGYWAWGSYSWELHPYPQTDMSGNNGPRSKFFVHGGYGKYASWGSAGCIDLMYGDIRFNDEVVTKVTMQQGQSCCYIDVDVDYAVSTYEQALITGMIVGGTMGPR
jgi:hypothetical protein